MSELTVAVRAAHYAAVILLFGGLVFLLGVARPAYGEVAGAMSEERQRLHRWLLRVMGWSVAVVLASGVLWLAIEAAGMSGLPLDQALNRPILGAVLSDTLFGRIWEIRFGLALALGACLLFGRTGCDARGWLILGAGCGPLAGGLLATLAWAGHAAVEQGFDRYVHLSADAAHLLAAGAWLGALPPLVFVLARARSNKNSGSIQFAAQAVRRFSAIGLISVGILVASGGVNAWYLVGDVPGLFGTAYGRLLLLKLGLFALMLTLAAVNRVRLMPQLVAAPGAASAQAGFAALRWLWGNAAIETALGLAILSIVGGLGVTPPALHTQPVWPFPFTLAWEAAEVSAGLRILMFAIGAAGLAAASLVVFGAGIRKRWMAFGGLAGIGIVLSVSAWFLTVPAYPSTYFRSPVRYTVSSIAHGASLFAEHCVICHGPYGYGDGPAAASLPVKPADLTQHLFHHREGDLFWWLTNGMQGTPMPGFGDRIGETGRWDLINFLRAQAEAERAREMNAEVEPWRPFVSPDFAFQIDRRPQETLKQQRGRFIVLLVLYMLPESHARLRELAQAKKELEQAGVRMLAMPMNNGAIGEANAKDLDDSMVATPNPQLVTAYMMFARSASAQRTRAVPHMEFLIDRQGYLRARWMPARESGWGRMPELLRQVEILNREKPRAPAPEGHMH